MFYNIARSNNSTRISVDFVESLYFGSPRSTSLFGHRQLLRLQVWSYTNKNRKIKSTRKEGLTTTPKDYFSIVLSSYNFFWTTTKLSGHRTQRL